MKEIFEIINNIMSKIKNKKIIVLWFIIIFLIILILYPIIDANFLYYGRIEKRIRILENISKINTEEISKDDRMKNEYDSILDDMDKQKDKNINKIIKFESSKKENLLKGISMSWMFGLAAIMVIFNKDKITGKLSIKNNLLSSFVCIVIALIFAWIATYIPIILNIWVTCIFIQGFLLYFIYVISKISVKK